MQSSTRRTGIAITICSVALSLAACGSESRNSTGRNDHVSRSTTPALRNNVWYVNLVSGIYSVTLTTDESDGIAQSYPSPLTVRNAKAIREKIANLYTYDPNSLVPGSIPEEILETLQDTYGKDGLSLSYSQLASMIPKLLSACAPFTSDGYEPASLECISAIQPEISGEAQDAAIG
jgi:hypothetical protein